MTNEEPIVFVKNPDPKEAPKSSGHVSTIEVGKHIPLYGEDRNTALVSRILAKAREEVQKSNQGHEDKGDIPKPVNFDLLKKLHVGNPHHSSCIEAKVNAAVGLGFKNPEVEKTLGKITRRGFRPLLLQAGKDFEDTGNGYLEVVRKGEGGKPTGIHFTAQEGVHPQSEGDNGEIHFKVEQPNGESRLLAAYGDKEGFMERNKESLKKGIKPEEVSELIHFWMPSNLSTFFGVPDWLACAPLMDMVQTQNQYWYDFFQNWGSVAKFLSITSHDEIDEKTWRKIETAFLATVKGDGAFKSFVANLVGDEIEIEVHDLGGDPFTSTAIEADRNLALDICAAHRTPPALANVIPTAKNISSNKGVLRETVDVWQAMVIGMRQLVFQETLERTLGCDFVMTPIKDVKQEISGITQEMITVEKSGWTLKKLRDEMEFEMTPQLGGPKVASGKEEEGTANQSKPDAS